MPFDRYVTIMYLKLGSGRINYGSVNTFQLSVKCSNCRLEKGIGVSSTNLTIPYHLLYHTPVIAIQYTLPFLLLITL